MQAVGEKIYCFEDFTLDLRRGALRCGEREIDLRPKSFEVLRYLVENAGRLVPKDELIEAVWPSVVVTDESLARCVSDVRQALGDSQQRIIKTVPRRGYLFGVSVSEPVGTAGSEQHALQPERDRGKAVLERRTGTIGAVPEVNDLPASAVPQRTSRRIWVAFVGLVAALVLVGGIWILLKPAQVPQRAGAVPRLSIVVLPFANLSGDPAQEYLADAITTELTAGLARIRGSLVIARTTALTYKGKTLTVKEIGRELGVRYVLEGTEQHSGNRVRVNAQLIDAETGAHVWGDKFDADRADLFNMQDEIVTRLARSLDLQTITIEAARIARTRPGNLDAEDLAMRCVAGVDSSSLGSAAQEAALGLCEKALEIDERSVLALCVLAGTSAVRAASGMSAKPQVDIQQADELVSRALALEPDSYYAHGVKAWILISQNRHKEAIVEAERTLALNPSYIIPYTALDVANWYLGQPDKTIEYADTAIRLSPRDPNLWAFYHHKGMAYSMLKNGAQAIEWYRQAIALAPQFPLSQAGLAAELALGGQEAEAHEMLQRYLSLKGTRARTIAEWKRIGHSDNPVFLAAAERLTEGLRKAGMSEE
jgi:TolB-like protein/DNA-binding winged helix-turn-helix (wHTH) protein/Tfp pilus assembly protein PilF